LSTGGPASLVCRPIKSLQGWYEHFFTYTRKW
jgi:hypothetical protein